RQVSDSHRWLECRLPGRRKFHAAPLWAERGPGKPRAIQFARVRQALRGGVQASRFTRTDETLRSNDGARVGVCAVASDGASDRRPPGAGMGAKLQAASGADCALAIHRHRCCAAAEMIALLTMSTPERV